MKKAVYLLAGASLLHALPALAQSAPTQTAPVVTAKPQAENANQEVFSTGVAKGRDRLDSATSTSALRGSEAEKLGPRPLADILRTMPGLRVESGIGEGNANYTVRGLPLAAGGSKYMQIQEDGLPVIEFGDFFNFGADVFSRADFNLAQIESIRGGSASTFASDSPGGLINLISKTGETQGGSIQFTKGLDYGENRFDADYGGKLSDSLRFHVGGFYRWGEGPRNIGFTGYKGGQIRANITKQFSNGYIRVHAKYLDDRSPTFAPYFFKLTGTDSNPTIANLPGFDIRKDSVLSPYIGPVVTLDGENKLQKFPLKYGMHPVSKSVGLEAQFEVGGFTLTDRARYSANKGDFLRVFPNTADTVTAFAASQAGAGAVARYASGPNAGQLVPTNANGNGLLALFYMAETRARSLDNFTNDFRATRVWRLGEGNLTVTAGLYKAIQTLKSEWLHSAFDADVAGDAQTAMVNITSATGVPQTVDGYYAYGRGRTSKFRRIFDVKYNITAPYASVNYHVGKVAIGGSLRYDSGRVRGQLFGADLEGGRVGLVTQDMNGDGVITAPERSVAYLPLTQPAPVNYNYGYLSYSAGVNYRIAEQLSAFARYSRGGRANADKILFTPIVSTTDGSVADSKDKYDEVRQLEGGFKFRTSNATLNGTAFLAHADDHNVLNGSANRTFRSYRAYGLELEGSYRTGPFSVTAGATYTKAKITEDKLDPTLTGKEPRHQPAWTLQATPQYETELFTVGANVVTITSSYAQDSNLLKMPGFTVVNAFVQFRPVERVQLMVNAYNLFDKIGFFEISQSTVPANGIGSGRAINGRTVSAALRYDF
ncbi:TonB-dependent receptor domain-containing protein [Novosphingobium sp. JCM 18896]|uniref:TonB-dependent receptor domain-containing protein n=1 Tax=Novosphingobium sp. JCM 18896 TaxID=2989731 RepID=UPI002223658A|nr:TonB-dependent receptor [Novosphingobium sp. JCM 18896]MCW1429951.1 TonB-dependent receptor [Novosphingobium sp. JCM 18896]